MDGFVFDPWDSRYKMPFGAITDNQELTVSVKIHRSLGTVHPRMVLCNDHEKQWEYPLLWQQRAGSYDIWITKLTVGAVGLYFYCFSIDTIYGERYGMQKNALVCDRKHGQLFQLTVYDSAFSTPDRYKGKVMYQIFPDRFACSGIPKEKVPSDRILRTDWGGIPSFGADLDGKIHNNDYFGGDLKGIEQKLPYLHELSVSLIYLNPIAEAHSNHRYNTADYTNVDPLLGSNHDFKSLCASAADNGIDILLDGVYSHTGDDSIYFNKYGRYPTVGAYQSQSSPYYSWYTFTRFPDEYACWWDILTLPEVREDDPQYMDFICGEDGVLVRWMELGAAGYRLDVADELPDDFIRSIALRMKQQNENALLLGEVWEDASNKISYGKRREYLLGQELHSVMNYPFRQAILSFVRYGDGAAALAQIMTILDHYPKQVVDVMMNFLSTHDTPRAITLLAGEPQAEHDRSWQASQHLTQDERALGISRLTLAFCLLYCLPGNPCIYYGDELGMEGYGDPFNRGCMRWDQTACALHTLVTQLGKLRHAYSCFAKGEFVPYICQGDIFSFWRSDENSAVFIAVNRSAFPVDFPIPPDSERLMGEWDKQTGELSAHSFFIARRA